jgi:mRNA capping enzyme, beta chain
VDVPHTGQTVEIEGKLGQIFDKRTQRRLEGNCEQIVDSRDIFFKSDMTINQHASLNKALNSLVDKGAGKIGYVHTRQTDLFYSHANRKVRQTIEGELNGKDKPKVLTTIYKVRKHVILRLRSRRYCC